MCPPGPGLARGPESARCRAQGGWAFSGQDAGNGRKGRRGEVLPDSFTALAHFHTPPTRQCRCDALLRAGRPLWNQEPEVSCFQLQGVATLGPGPGQDPQACPLPYTEHFSGTRRPSGTGHGCPWVPDGKVKVPRVNKQSLLIGRRPSGAGRALPLPESLWVRTRGV